jgi:hypothetical protein
VSLQVVEATVTAEEGQLMTKMSQGTVGQHRNFDFILRRGTPEAPEGTWEKSHSLHGQVGTEAGRAEL